MFEPRNALTEAHEHFADRELEAEVAALESLLTPVAAPPVAIANPGFQLPARIWKTMVACYAIFFVAIFAATGGSGVARFMIVVSVLYTVMFFGLARIGARQAGREERSPLDRGQPLSTSTGWMDARSVASQVLVVPVIIAFFGVSIAVIAGVVI